MKAQFAPIIAGVMILFGSACNNNEEAQKKFDQKMDSVHNLMASRDSSISEFLTSFNEIESNIDSVAIKQNIISSDVSKQKGELKANVKEHINEQIAAINDFLEQNRKKIESLNGKLKKYSLNIRQFEKMISSLNEQITQKNAELDSLNAQLNQANAQVAQLKTSVDTLTHTNGTQSEMIASQTAAMHTAYYVVGKSKDLEEMKIIDKKGGVLGIGKTSKINGDVNPNNFTKIDYTQVTTIPINSKKATVVSSHPSDSYTLDKDSDDKYTDLRITNAEKFWSTSKYLVVVNN